ncbi:hypothetical protein Rhopal_001232-T1 [Rhodotorula paludigena]|uniref:Calcineurin-like phosphoesterase domain-containing protein n=1 Tax=Rhodotorula paludigena TaxID=86838 RepID=A0AAV5GGU5_9BASI|nr:hypothetical protein Rhopal_001232-T1 [Rhodotorula paludigena]
MNRIVSSPVIRKPSLAPLPRRRRTLTPPLPPLLVLVLRVLLVLLVFWAEHLSFRLAASWHCAFDDSPSVRGRVWDGASPPSSSAAWIDDARWRAAAQRRDRRGTPFHVLVVADPQLLDMRSYPGRNWALRWLGVKITDLYARKSWKAVTGYSRGKSGGGLDAVVWLGDLLDSGTETVDHREHSAYVHRFHLLFPLPRASTSSFSTLSSSSTGRSSLTPPVPSIIVPGNHDLGLHRGSTALAAYGREVFRDTFGPTWGVREWNGWEVVWVDAMALLEPEYWEGDGGEFKAMRRWLETGMGGGQVTVPRILLTHIPLYRPEGTSCGRQREHSRPIRQGAGRNYQNELDERATRYLMRLVRPSIVYSGDDHDYCFLRHEGYTSPLDGKTPVGETTVKAFSMAMGIRRPGYHLLSLYAPLPPLEVEDPDDPETPVSYTYTQKNCTLPDQLGTYLHLYLPLFGSFVLFFFVPKLAVVVRTAVQRRRTARRVASARANGLPSAASTPHLGNGAGGAPGTPGRGGPGHGHKRSLSRTLLGGLPGSRRVSTAEEDADAEDVEAQFPGLLGGLAHLDHAGGYYGGGPPTDDEHGFDDGGEFGAHDALEAGGAGGAPGTPGKGHVRRVSRVWLWEGTSKPSSPSHSISLSGGPASSPSRASLPARIARLFQRAFDRLAANSLLAPLSRHVLRPVVRAARSTWRKLAAPFVRLAGGKGLGGPLGQAGAEAVAQTWEVAWPAVVCWVAVAAWYWV